MTGFAFYMYMVSKGGELRPFVIYVIEEGGAKAYIVRTGDPLPLADPEDADAFAENKLRLQVEWLDRALAR